MIRLLIADDQALVRGALAALLGLEADIEVVAQVGRGDEVVEAARTSEATVALLDIEMPGIDGIAAAAQLRAEVPGCRALIVTTFGRPGYLARAMQAGASGFVVKDTPATELAAACGGCPRDSAWSTRSRRRVARAGRLALTERETDVLAAARDGGTIADIARTVHLSEGTVKNHLSSAIGKTGGRNRADAVRVAVERGWL